AEAGGAPLGRGQRAAPAGHVDAARQRGDAVAEPPARLRRPNDRPHDARPTSRRRLDGAAEERRRRLCRRRSGKVRRLPATTVFYGIEFALSMPAFVVAVVYFVREVHMSPLQLVATGTVMEVAVFLFEVPTGVVADTYGRRLSLAIAFLVQGAAWILVGAVPTFWVIALAWFLWGFGATFESGAHQAWITDEVGVERVGGI